MSYNLSFEGFMPAELRHLLQAVENRLNGHELHAQLTSQAFAATAASDPCPASSASCGGTDGTKGIHDLVIVLLTAAVAGAVGYGLGRKSKST